MGDILAVGLNTIRASFGPKKRICSRHLSNSTKDANLVIGHLFVLFRQIRIGRHPIVAVRVHDNQIVAGRNVATLIARLP
jgi:hypothetical protein